MDLPESVAWIGKRDDGVTIDIAVQPGARRNEVVGEHGGALKVKVTAPPVEGAANDALVDFVAKRLGLKKRQVHILKGHQSRRKILLIEGASEGQVIRNLVGSSNAC